MQLGMIGLGRMGANMVRRLMRGGHQCVVWDQDRANVEKLAGEGARGAATLEDFLKALQPPRAVWMMIPAAAVDGTLAEVSSRMERGDIVIDGGNSYYIDDIRRAKEMDAKGLHYVDVGTSGGVWGLERGFCQMIGGQTEIVQHLDAIFKTLAPGRGNADRRGLFALRPFRRGTLRQNGSQRNRVRTNGGLRGGAEHFEARQCREA
jgi:6-phosphogluconate dehydrogenase